jgi:FMN phosphatase YigB (HAD superfamily)
MIAAMCAVLAVMFDWRGTLVADWPDEWWVRRAFSVMNMPYESDNVGSIVEALRTARRDERIAPLLETEDLSADQHRRANLAWFEAAGLEPSFSETLYKLDYDPDAHPFADDVPEVLRGLRDRGVRVAVVSDIHFDIRPEFDAAGLAGLVDAFVLSFEHGVCKPEPGIFEIALGAVGVVGDEALMVGDRPGWDGGAVHLGIPTLLLPPLRRPQDRRMHLVLALVDA